MDNITQSQPATKAELKVIDSTKINSPVFAARIRPSNSIDELAESFRRILFSNARVV